MYSQENEEQKEKPVTEQDRWLIVAAIFSAIGTAITAYFAGRR